MISNQPPPDPPITLAFDLIARYAQRHGWIPIGFRTFTVGPWTITVNGTRENREPVPPYHALIEHASIVSFMLISPWGGSIGGWQYAEEQFIHDLEAALLAEPFA